MQRQFSASRLGVSRRRLHRTTAGERSEWVDRFRKSNLSPRDFAHSHGLPPATLLRWLRAHRSEAKAPRFHEIRLPARVPESGSDWDAEIQLPSGTRVRLRGDWARSMVAAALAPLR